MDALKTCSMPWHALSEKGTPSWPCPCLTHMPAQALLLWLLGLLPAAISPTRPSLLTLAPVSVPTCLSSSCQEAPRHPIPSLGWGHMLRGGLPSLEWGAVGGNISWLLATRGLPAIHHPFSAQNVFAVITSLIRVVTAHCSPTMIDQILPLAILLLSSTL